MRSHLIVFVVAAVAVCSMRADAQDVVSSISTTNTAPYFSIGMDISRYTSEQAGGPEKVL